MKSIAKITKLTVEISHTVEYELIQGVGCGGCAFNTNSWKKEGTPCLDMKNQNICTNKELEDDTFGFVLS
jgi:hypothetical protein